LEEKSSMAIFPKKMQRALLNFWLKPGSLAKCITHTVPACPFKRSSMNPATSAEFMFLPPRVASQRCKTFALVCVCRSPFNIADQVKLPPFSLKNVQDLYAQYTEETNQPFTAEAVMAIYTETTGQPWIVNRLGTILTVDIKPETTEPITQEDVLEAVEILLYEDNSHFDNITEKAKQYKETFIRRF
jgi:hypothetical protein